MDRLTQLLATIRGPEDSAEDHARNEGYAAADDEGRDIERTKNPYADPKLREAWEVGQKNFYLQVDMWLHATLYEPLGTSREGA